MKTFILILFYVVTGFGVYFFLKAEDDGETTVLSSIGHVATFMTGGFGFDDKSDRWENAM